ncbi:NPC intracellular cholesterol transporter 2-like [Schistocerca nitens]|uniref:NPC intracellular cholesterol transporter 2-like n=1 Tax=Schistocerca nitens TaxID=7011 RepID=UPI002119678E|nr:NPC intracellular cholesterol transporter 2-like [Schistocerca nitens]XP_049801949.1 NPC intracellular cholesterol transporter 2-like [Schistocerca nitens]
MPAAVALALCCLVVAAVATPYSNCTDGEPAILSLDVQGCNESPCPVVAGTEIIADVLFAVEKPTESVSPLVEAVVFGATITYPVPEPDGCKSLVQAECPLEHGEHVTYRLQMSLPKGLPGLTLPVRLTLKDDNADPMACFQISVKVVTSSA